MSRTLNAQARAQADTALGTEPITIVGVQWSNHTTWYADKELPGLQGTILSASGIDSIIKLKRGGSAGSVSIELDDTDGAIKTLFDAHDIHKAKAWVYQSYADIDPFNDKFLVLSGIVATPIEWSEGERTLSIEIISNIEDAEIGFSPEEGAFPNMADSAIGKAWPLCFGSPIRVPAVRVIEQVRGTSLTRYGLISRTEADELCTKAIALAKAKRAKDQYVQDQLDRLADNNDDEDPLDDDTYEEGLADAINNVTVTYVALLNYQERLVSVNPEQEDNVQAYADLCVELNDAEAALAAAQLQAEELEDQLLAVQVAKDEAETAWEVAKFLHLQDVLNIEKAEDFFAATTLLDVRIKAVEAKQEEIDEFGDTVAQAQNVVTNLTADQLALKAELIAWTLETIEVDNGEKFPQGTTLDIIVNGVRLEGIFNVRTFTISDATKPTYRDLTFAARERVTPNLLWLQDIEAIKGHYCLIKINDNFSPNHRIVYIESQNSSRCAYNPVVWEAQDELGKDFEYYRPAPGNGNILETSPIFLTRWDTYFPGKPHITGLQNLPDNDWQLNIGDTVYLASDFQEKYVANLIPSTTIHEVLAERTVRGETRLQPIPSSYYSINLNESIAGQNATTITFKRPLRDYTNEGWSDQVYVTLTSSVGPNTASIIEWLINTYGEFTPDASSFAFVQSALANYPSHFPILERRNLLETIEDIAWQARCYLYLRNQVAYIKYAAYRYSASDTITEDDIDLKSMSITFFKTEELVTRFVAKWRPDWYDDENEIVLRNNIGKYGDVKEEFTFWIYNIRSLVEKSAQFWLIRYSNSWKYLKFTSPLTKIDLESLDTVDVTFVDPWVANTSIRGEIQTAQLDTGNNKIAFDIWLPVRAGEMSEYVFAYPASAAVDEEYPTPLDLFAGGSSDGEPAQAEVYNSETRAPDLGPKNPSDSADSAPINPTVGRNEINYIVNDQRGEDNADVGLTEIDIRTTPIIDSIKGTRTTLDTMVEIADDPEDDETRLALQNDALMTGLVDGDTTLGRIENKYDDPKWRPAAAFLKED